MSNRKKMNNVYEDRYKLLNGERHESDLYWLCVYCGLPADSRDHVPPISKVVEYESFGLDREQYFKVPCCLSCNKILNDSLQENIIQRVNFLKDKLEKRYKKVLAKVEWDEDELEEIGPNLLTKIRENSVKGAVARSRVDYYGGLDALLGEIEV